MKMTPLLVTVAGVASAVLAPVATSVQSQGLALPAGDPGPGWTRWTARRRGVHYGGPVYVDGPGRYHGYYRWQGDYYAHCAWRRTGPGPRQWHCW